MSEKRERKTTPLGEAKWAHLHTPKAPFKDEQGRSKGDPKYMIDVIFSKDDPEWAEWANKVMKAVADVPEQVDKKTGDKLKKQIPIKRELNENDEPTGRFYVTFKTSDKFKPGVFDRYGRQIPEGTLIGNGSLVRVSYVEAPYTAFGGGVTFYLNGVQVQDLVEYKAQNASAYGFPVDEAPAPDESEIPFN